MIHFECDYTEGAHPRIMEKLISTNMEQTTGYGVDDYCADAAAKIKKICGREDVDVHFLVGGTQTNTTVISSALRPYQGVVAADSGHINTHETGAIEAAGHKVLPIPGTDGKITAAQVEALCRTHFEDGSAEHTVQPGMLYISQPTELGTLYQKKEMEALADVCRKYGLYFFVDGARLGYALAAPDNDLSLAELAALCDVFYIGGTKVGALFGEAVVIADPVLKKDFRYMIKQNGGMLAKGRLLGLQFGVLFENGLYEQISAHAIEMAEKLRSALEEENYPYFVKNRTNQIFTIIPDHKLEQLQKKYSFCFQQKMDETHTAVRICTSWATREENVEALINDLKTL